jgi:hypothetical protein
MEANQYTFDHKEAVELLIKKADIHEGKWVLMVTLGFTAGNFTTGVDQAMPGAIVLVQKFGIQRAEPGSPESLVVDAALVNPANTINE